MIFDGALSPFVLISYQGEKDTGVALTKLTMPVEVGHIKMSELHV